MKTYYELLSDFCIALTQHGYEQPKGIVLDKETMKRFSDEIGATRSVAGICLMATQCINGPIEVTEAAESRNLIIYAPRGSEMVLDCWHHTRKDCDRQYYEFPTVKINVNVKLIEE